MTWRMLIADIDARWHMTILLIVRHLEDKVILNVYFMANATFVLLFKNVLGTSGAAIEIYVNVYLLY